MQRKGKRVTEGEKEEVRKIDTEIKRERETTLRGNEKKCMYVFARMLFPVVGTVTLPFLPNEGRHPVHLSNKR